MLFVKVDKGSGRALENDRKGFVLSLDRRIHVRDRFDVRLLDDRRGLRRFWHWIRSSDCEGPCVTVNWQRRTTDNRYV